MNTPLHVAVRNGSHRVLELLVEKGAQMDVINKKDRTILHIAATANRPETLKVGNHYIVQLIQTDLKP